MNNSIYPQFNQQPAGMYAQQQFGDYRVQQKIGAGGMAEVYQAFHPSFQTVALKVLNLSAINDHDMVQRFLQEATMVRQLHHPHIVAIYDTAQVWFAPTQHYIPLIAMEYITGGTLTERLQQQPKQLLNPALQMVKQIGSALDYAHGKGFIHRDIKPSNILFRNNGEAVLADFGIALAKNQARITRVGGFVGTIAYTAPEVFEGITPDQRADMYALGLILYEALAGIHPYHHETDSHEHMTINRIQRAELPPLRQFAPYVPPGIVEVINQAIARNPNDRFATMADFLEALEKTRFSPSKVNVAVPQHTTVMQTPASRPNVALARPVTSESIMQTFIPPATNERNVATYHQPASQQNFNPGQRSRPNAASIGAVPVRTNTNQPIYPTPKPEPWYTNVRKRWMAIGASVIGLILIFFIGGKIFGNDSTNKAPINPGNGGMALVGSPSPVATATPSFGATAIPTVTEPSDPHEAKRLDYIVGQEAYAQQDWPNAAAAFDKVREIDPAYLDLSNIGSATYYNWTINELTGPDKVTASLELLNKTFRFKPDHQPGTNLAKVLKLYHNGQTAAEQQGWQTAINAYQEAQAAGSGEFGELMGKLQIVKQLYEAYLGRGRELEEAGDTVGANAIYRKAAALKELDSSLDVAAATSAIRATNPTAVPATATRSVPTPVPPTPVVQRLYFQKYAENAVDPTCFGVHIRGVNTNGWFVTADGLGNRGNVDGAGNTNVCGLAASQQVTFTVFNAAGQPVLGGAGIPTRGGDLMAGYWQ